MLYVAIERQPTLEMGNFTAPAMLMCGTPNGEAVAVFLTKVHGYMYLRGWDPKEEFKLVEVKSFDMGIYEKSAQAMQDNPSLLNTFHDFHVVVGFSDKDTVYRPLLSTTPYLLPDIMFKETDIRNNISKELSSKYLEEIAELDKLNHEEMVNLVQSQMPKGVLADEEDKVIPNFDENRKLNGKPLGYSHVFALIDKKLNQPWVTRQGNQFQLCLFPNKLDATIIALLLQEMAEEPLDLDIALLHQQTRYKAESRFWEKQGRLQIGVVHGFLKVSTTLGPQWAKFSDDIFSVSPLIMNGASFDTIEQGFNLSDYLVGITDPKETEIAISSLIKTNLKPFEELKPIAKGIIHDMKQQQVMMVERDNTYIFPSRCFAG